MSPLFISYTRETQALHLTLRTYRFICGRYKIDETMHSAVCSLLAASLVYTFALHLKNNYADAHQYINTFVHLSVVAHEKKLFSKAVQQYITLNNSWPRTINLLPLPLPSLPPSLYTHSLLSTQFLITGTILHPTLPYIKFCIHNYCLCSYLCNTWKRSDLHTSIWKVTWNVTVFFHVIFLRGFD